MISQAVLATLSGRLPKQVGHRRAGLVLCLAFALGLGSNPARPAEPDAIPFLADVTAKICPADAEDLNQIVELVAGAELMQVIDKELPGRGILRSNRILDLPQGERLHLDWWRLEGRLLRFGAELHRPVGEGRRPAALVLTGPDCVPAQARRILYAADGRAESLEILGADLGRRLATEPLDPPLPEGADPGGVTVAVVDSGIAYNLPVLAVRLARDADGRVLGHDYWDLDAYPYDLNTAASPFFPRRHGTTVASLLVAEAPDIRLLPYRYPRPDMARFAELIAAADKAGAAIVALPMGSRDPDDWAAFRTAATSRLHMLLVVSAGNDGRDIDRDPVYPAAFDLENMIVVTSAEGDGRLAPGSNWGATAVDLMVPAERRQALNHLGAEVQVSGASYAVPRVAALAARLKAAHPGWAAEQLKAAILARSNPVPGPGPSPTRFGWIAEADLAD